MNKLLFECIYIFFTSVKSNFSINYMKIHFGCSKPAAWYTTAFKRDLYKISLKKLCSFFYSKWQPYIYFHMCRSAKSPQCPLVDSHYKFQLKPKGRVNCGLDCWNAVAKLPKVVFATHNARGLRGSLSPLGISVLKFRVFSLRSLGVVIFTSMIAV